MIWVVRLFLEHGVNTISVKARYTGTLIEEFQWKSPLSKIFPYKNISMKPVIMPTSNLQISQQWNTKKVLWLFFVVQHYKSHCLLLTCVSAVLYAKQICLCVAVCLSVSTNTKKLLITCYEYVSRLTLEVLTFCWHLTLTFDPVGYCRTRIQVSITWKLSK